MLVAPISTVPLFLHPPCSSGTASLASVSPGKHELFCNSKDWKWDLLISAQDYEAWGRSCSCFIALKAHKALIYRRTKSWHDLLPLGDWAESSWKATVLTSHRSRATVKEHHAISDWLVWLHLVSPAFQQDEEALPVFYFLVSKAQVQPHLCSYHTLIVTIYLFFDSTNLCWVQPIVSGMTDTYHHAWIMNFFGCAGLEPWSSCSQLPK
jgi:hypothetical protein